MHQLSRKACHEDKSFSCATAEESEFLVKGEPCKTGAAWLGLSQTHRFWRCLPAGCMPSGPYKPPWQLLCRHVAGDESAFGIDSEEQCT